MSRIVEPASMLEPSFRMSFAGFTVGPLLSRSLRGGIFAIVRDGAVLADESILLAPLGPHDPGDAALNAFAVRSRAQVRPGVAQVFATGMHRGLRWIHLERVTGWSLRTLLGRREINFSGARLAMLGAELANALAPLHAAGTTLELVHGRLGTGHVVVDRAGRVRLCGLPIARSEGSLPDVIGVGAVVACAALGVCPDPRGVTPATARTLAQALDRPENVARSPLGLRRLVQSLLWLHSGSFLPSTPVLRDQFLQFAEGLSLRQPDPSWGRVLAMAVSGVSTNVRPTPTDVEAVLDDLVPCLGELARYVAPTPAPPTLANIVREFPPMDLAETPVSSPTPALNRSPPPAPVAVGEATSGFAGQTAPLQEGRVEKHELHDHPFFQSAPPTLEMPILPALHDTPEPKPVRSLRERMFPLLVG